MDEDIPDAGGARDEEIRRIKDVQSKNEMNVRYEA